MIHYHCDRCGKKIDTDSEIRYVVRIEVQACFDPVVTDDDADHLLQLEEILERLEDSHSDAIGEEIYHRRRHDLCTACFHEYQQNPLAMEPQVSLGFSDN